MLLPLFISLCNLGYICAFNIDVSNAIVFKLPSDGKRRSYFGTSVAIRPRADELLEKDWIFQIGAPRSNISGIAVDEPGAVFRCRVNGLCSLYKLDQKGNVQSPSRVKNKGPKNLFVERKDHGWVGVSMDMTRYREGEVTVICGHRISYQAQTEPLNIVDKIYLSIGGCYVDLIYWENKTDLYLPLNNESNAYYMIDEERKTADFNWGQGLAGMSSHLSTNGLLLGAPNVYYMTGTILKYQRNWKMQPFVAEMSAIIETKIRIDYFAYNGYSVGSGNFFGDGLEWYVFGAPRGYDLHGRICAAQFQIQYGKKTLKIHHSVQRGETYGEYFGASLGVGDLNGDGFDDLVVGAPMFSQQFVEQGRVYVFLGSKKGFKENIVLNGVAEQGRFGTSVCVAGDLDQDGYKDLIVGAPYQGNGGALFIYRGGPQGVSQHHSQVIHAHDIKMNMRGFGMSISRAVDVDRNKYPDVLVGAYQSDEAVLLRSRPVIFLTPTIKHPEFLDRKQNKFIISVCFNYSSSHPPPKIWVDAVISIDEEMGRARFSSISSQIWNIYALQTSYTSPKCQNLTVTFDMKRLNGTFNVPVQVTLEVTLYQTPTTRTPQIVWLNQTKMHALEPITHDDEPEEKKTTVQVPFAGDCGLDNICQSQLQLQCEFDRTQIITNDDEQEYWVGYLDTLTVVIIVKNVKEPAHYTSLNVSFEGFSTEDIISQDSSCALSNASSHCKLATVTENADKKLTFLISTKNWAYSAHRQVYFWFHVGTVSVETNPKDSSCLLKLNLRSKASVRLLASATEATVSLTVDSQPVLNFSHTYEAEMKGKSPMTMMIAVSIPTKINGGMSFAALLHNNPDISIANQEEIQKLSGKAARGSFDELLSSSVSFPAERTLFLNCSSKNVECITYRYLIPPVSSNKDSEYPIMYNVSALEMILHGFDVIHFITNGTVIMEDRFGLKVYSSKETSTTIILVPEPAKVEVRIIALSAVVGGLLLALIIPILIRKGFFRRKTKEQMDTLKALDFINERFSMYEPDRSSRISIATVDG